ncbi:MAG TPA: L-glutamate gamma-semialdehyde dehydrogenase [Candidatus Krumholzibacteria bacterium]|nr:L-glutamate gamma-semialdehyde dehydrogenase [Candidatus Krumholzibacteria bacterium]
MPTPFVNEPFSNFGDPAVADQMQAALDKVRAALGRDYPLVIGGEKVTAARWITSVDPSNPDNVVGRVAQGTEKHAEQAMAVALEAFESWRKVAAEERAAYLFRAAKIIRDRKFEYAAWMVYEVGKSWAEADGDVAETIDFLEFYGREALRLAEVQPVTKLAGEENELVYIPLGVGAVIPPWNFPMAIMAGMTSAAIVAGNTVVMKPSSDSPIIAAKFVEVMQEVGLPAGVLNFVPGGGREVGNYLVEHPKTRFIAFTGSKEVGLHINHAAATPRKDQIWIKRAVLEMGGKDSIVVDDECDLDAAVKSVVASAFGFQGQKCSACSRAIVHQKVYDEFVRKIVPQVEAIRLGVPYASKDVFMGPVINEGAMNSILDYIETGKGEGTLLAGGARAAGNGYFVQPTLFGGIAPDATISLEEIFGPVLALIKARDFDHAMQIANNTEYGLTGALFSSNREHIERARRDFHVGNLYFNRKCTGALVGVHPFGGFNMSGTDSKAGGRDYLLLFTQAKSVSEKVK